MHAELDDGTTAQARPPKLQHRCASRCSCAGGAAESVRPLLCVLADALRGATGSGPGVQGDPRLHATWAASHPPSWERAAVRGLLGVLRAEMQGEAPSAALRAGGDGGHAGGGGFGLHIAHVADVGVVDMLDAARAEGATQPFTALVPRLMVSTKGALLRWQILQRAACFDAFPVSTVLKRLHC